MTRHLVNNPSCVYRKVLSVDVQEINQKEIWSIFFKHKQTDKSPELDAFPRL